MSKNNNKIPKYFGTLSMWVCLHINVLASELSAAENATVAYEQNALFRMLDRKSRSSDYIGAV
jgi:hypothetical protein